jgi:hypothetical protein
LSYHRLHRFKRIKNTTPIIITNQKPKQMKKIKLIIIMLACIVIGVGAKAQIVHCQPYPDGCEMVANGDFENYDHDIPSPGIGLQHSAKTYFACPWFDPTAGSSDLFNNDEIMPSSPHWYNYVQTSPYWNFYGVQSSIDATGNISGGGYAGFAAYNEAPHGNKEYIAQPLKCAMIKGIPYLCSFWVSLSEHSTFATNHTYRNVFVI